MGLNIALVTNTSWNIWNFRRDLVDYLATQGHRVTVMAPYDEYSDLLTGEGYSLILLKKLRRKGTNPIRDLGFMVELRQHLSKNRIDLVLLYTIKPNIYGSFAAWMLGKSAICTLTGLGYSFGNNRILSAGVRLLYKISLHKASAIVFQNPDDAGLFVRHGLVNERKISVIPGSGIDIKRFQPVDKIDASGFHFIFIGRMLRDKGILEFCEAASYMTENYDDVRFTVLCKSDRGNPAFLSGKERKKFQDYSKSVFICHESDDVKKYLADSDVYVLPSYREGLPKSTLEAMAMGKAVITTDVPGCRETVDHLENGWLIAPKNTSQLVKAMEAARLAGQKQLKQMGEKSRKIVESKFSNEHILNKYLTLINQIQNITSF